MVTLTHVVRRVELTLYHKIQSKIGQKLASGDFWTKKYHQHASVAAMGDD